MPAATVLEHLARQHPTVRLHSAVRLHRDGVMHPAPARWSMAALAGRLVELAASEDAGGLTLAVRLVAEAQRVGETAAWVTLAESGFYPPDVAANGVDLAALPVVRVSDARAAGRAADRLAHCGAFGLIVLDVGAAGRIPDAQQGRLVQQAQRHHAVILCLTAKPRHWASLGSLVSLRVQAQRRRSGVARFTCGLTALKDKRRGPGWSHEEVCHGPAGLR